MSTRIVRIPLMALLLVLTLAADRASADVCVAIDDAHDTFSESDRTAALLLLARQLESAGEHVVAAGCSGAYVVAHVRLGDTIVVTMAGPRGRREATAIGMDDVPAVYSQLVRSLVSGRPMSARGIVDRTNVSEGQSAPPRRVESDSVLYTRLGYGGTFGDRAYGGPTFALIGYRKELDSFAIDVSFLNLQYKPSTGWYDESACGSTSSFIKLEALRFLSPASDRSAYWGGGFSVGTTHLQSAGTWWDGSGLQGDLSAGYELGRASTIRVFFQADLGLPMYELSGGAYRCTPASCAVTNEHRYAPSLAFSVGFGWQRGHRR